MKCLNLYRIASCKSNSQGNLKADWRWGGNMPAWPNLQTIEAYHTLTCNLQQFNMRISLEPIRGYPGKISPESTLERVDGFKALKIRGRGSSGSKQMCFTLRSGPLTINQPQGCLLAYASLIRCQSFAGTSQKQALRGSLILWGERLEPA